MHYSEVMSVSPGARNQFESYQPTAVLAGQDLERERQASLGETLQNEPGLSVRSLGPGPSRPVIRGLDGDRVLILQDGQRMGDLSSQSGDHGVNINPGAASRIEVVRGPATLLYGANAIGGLVNVITEDVPTGQVVGAKGSMSMSFGSATGEAGGGGDVTVVCPCSSAAVSSAWRSRRTARTRRGASRTCPARSACSSIRPRRPRWP